MTTVGVGIDLVDVDRVRRLLDQFGNRVLSRLLHEGERDYCRSKVSPAPHVAARVAAKEATYKALTQAGGDRVLWWHDMEVALDIRGAPGMIFHGRGKEVVDTLGIRDCLVSLTHSELQAGAVVVVTK